MQSSIPRESPEPAMPEPNQRQQLGDIELRQDMLLAQKSAKLTRGLCRVYGVGYSHSVDAPVDEDRSGPPSPALTSSSGSEAEVAHVESGTFARWEEVQQMIEGLNTDGRVRVLKEISRSLRASAERAERSLQEFDVRAEELSSDTGPVGVTDIVNEKLLNFRPEEMPAAQAVSRCRALMPGLRQLAEAQAEAQAQALKEAEALAEAQAQVTPSLPQGEPEPQPPEQGNGINRKLHQLGDLPKGAHANLHIVLNLQRDEIRNLAKQIQESERDLQIKKHALEYVDGKLNPQKEEEDELVNAAVSLTEEMRAKIRTRQKEEEKKRLQEEQEQMHSPTQEAQEREQEFERIEQEIARVAAHVKRLQEKTASVHAAGLEDPDSQEAAEGNEGEQPQHEGDVQDEGEQVQGQGEGKGDGEGDKGGNQSRRPKRGALDHAFYMKEASDGSQREAVDLTKLTEVHRRLRQDATELEERIAAEGRRVLEADAIMKNTEQTLKVLEEAKVLLLEHVAREKPALLEGLLPPEEEEDDDEVEDEGVDSGGSSDGLDDDDEDAGEEDTVERLKTMESEEQRLRSELAEAEADAEFEAVALAGEAEADGDEAGDESGADSDEEMSRMPSGADEDLRMVHRTSTRRQTQKGRQDLGNACCKGMLEIVQRLQDGASALQAALDGETGLDSSPSSSKGRELAREEALMQLRSMPHEELKALLRLRNDNSKLLKQIEESRADLERLRQKHGDPQALFEAVEANGPTEEGLTPELVAEVQRRARELCALRKRWWRDRQHETNTARRSLAALDLPEDPDTPDSPPSEESSLFQRIRASMLLP